MFLKYFFYTAVSYNYYLAYMVNNATIRVAHAAACIAVFFTIAAGQNSAIAPALDVTAISSKEEYTPGDTVIVALRVIVPGHYHLYGNPLGPGIGRPLSINVRGGDGVRWLDIVKMKAEKFRPAIGDWVWAYDKEAVFFLRGIAGPAGEVRGKAVFDALICYTACYPVRYELPFTVRIDPQAGRLRHFTKDKNTALLFSGSSETMPFKPETGQEGAVRHDMAALAGISGITPVHDAPAWKYTPREDKPDFNLLMAVLFGFLAGLILNAMPCVLPVLGVKILSFAHGQSRGRKSAVIHSLAFAAGIVSVFMLLAGLAAFADYSWGKLFQDPRALVAIIAFIVVFALGMFDVYLISAPASVSALDQKSGSGIGGDFFKGIFATILATPCSGPFLGAVLAWSVTRQPIVIFIVYGSIGAGMAFPYVLLSASRGLTGFLPKPGKWMQDFKRLMGFLLLGFAVYLMLGLPSDMIVPALLFCVAIALAVTVYSRFAPWGSSLVRKSRAFFLALMITGGGCFVSFFVVYPAFSHVVERQDEEGGQVWQKFSADSLRAAHAAGRNAVVDFTANWCMNCQYNYIMVLTKREVAGLIRKKNVLALKADMTLPDPVQDALLHCLGSQSIPFLAVFPGDRPDKPVVMRDILTKRNVMRALEQLP